MDDGGSRIMHYIVQRCEEDRDYWHHVTNAKDLQATAQGLEKGKMYNFQIRYTDYFQFCYAVCFVLIKDCDLCVLLFKSCERIWKKRLVAIKCPLQS